MLYQHNLEGGNFVAQEHIALPYYISAFESVPVDLNNSSGLFSALMVTSVLVSDIRHVTWVSNVRVLVVSIRSKA